MPGIRVLVPGIQRSAKHIQIKFLHYKMLANIDIMSTCAVHQRNGRYLDNEMPGDYSSSRQRDRVVNFTTRASQHGSALRTPHTCGRLSRACHWESLLHTGELNFKANREKGTSTRANPLQELRRVNSLPAFSSPGIKVFPVLNVRVSLTMSDDIDFPPIRPKRAASRIGSGAT